MSTKNDSIDNASDEQTQTNDQAQAIRQVDEEDETGGEGQTQTGTDGQQGAEGEAGGETPPAPENQVQDFALTFESPEAALGLEAAELSPELLNKLMRQPVEEFKCFIPIRRLADGQRFEESYVSHIQDPKNPGQTIAQPRLAILEGYSCLIHRARTTDESKSMDEDHVQAQIRGVGYAVRHTVSMVGGKAHLVPVRDAHGNLIPETDEHGKAVLTHLYWVNAQRQDDNGQLRLRYLSRDNGVMLVPAPERTNTVTNVTYQPADNRWNTDWEFHPGLVSLREVLRAWAESTPTPGESQAQTNTRLFSTNIPIQERALAAGKMTMQRAVFPSGAATGLNTGGANPTAVSELEKRLTARATD